MSIFFIVILIFAVLWYYDDAREANERAELHKTRASILRRAYENACIDFDELHTVTLEAQAGWTRSMEEIKRLKGHEEA